MRPRLRPSPRASGGDGRLPASRRGESRRRGLPPGGGRGGGAIGKAGSVLHCGCEDMKMRRREVIALCGAAAAVALPRVAQAQARRLGVLTTANDLEWRAEKAALLEE